MRRKHIFTGILVALCGLMALSGCQNKDENIHYLKIAENKATDYKLVSYLSSEDPVKEFAADLVIKTGVKFSIASGAGEGGHAILIGTAGQLREAGGISTTLSTPTSYEIKVMDGNIYVSLGVESIAGDVLTILKDSVTKIESGVFGVDSALSIHADICSISEVVPMFETTGTALDVHDCGNGNFLCVYHHMDVSVAEEEIAAYEKQLISLGYTLYQENTIMENRFAIYEKGDTLVSCAYYGPMREYRIVYGPKGFLPGSTPITDYRKVVTPSVSIIGMTENVECLVVQLGDGSFIVIDGGFDESGPQTKTLNAGARNEREVSYFRDVEKDMDTLYRFMKSRTPGGGKPQVTWMMTHADPDHILLPPRFIREYKDKFDLNMAVYNFPNMHNIGLGQGRGSTNDPAIMTTYAETFINAVTTCFPEAHHLIYHTGEKLYLPGCETEFLMTPSEDYWPHAMNWMNDTSGVWRFTIEGKTILIPGDAEKGLCNQMVGVYGGYLQSDILQVVHHGANGATHAFYTNVDPTVCLWTCQQYHLDYDNRQCGVASGYEFNKVLRMSKKVIAHLSNSETHTVLLPSLEIQ